MRSKPIHLWLVVIAFGMFACAKNTEITPPTMQTECLSHTYDDYTRIVNANYGDTIDFKFTFTGDELAELKLMQVPRMEVYDIQGHPNDEKLNGVTELRFQYEMEEYGFPYTNVSKVMYVSIVADTLIKSHFYPAQTIKGIHNFAVVMSNQSGEIAFNYLRYEIK